MKPSLLKDASKEYCLVNADFCYGNEDLAFSISEAIKLCVTVVAYAPESFRRYRSSPSSSCIPLLPLPVPQHVSPPVSRC